MAIKADERVERLLVSARDAGMPRDQMARFLPGGYIPLPAMLGFHAAARECDNRGGPFEIGLGGTRGPGKTHAVFAQVAIDDCQRVPGLKWLFLRKVQKSASEAFDDLARRILVHTPHTQKDGVIEFPNGSRILVGGFNNEAEIDKYLGINYDGLVIEEATQISEKKKDMIYGSIRTTIPGWSARKYLTTNPAGVGLQWFKRLFVAPWRNKTQTTTRFFHSDWRDNPFLDDGYRAYLMGLTGSLGKAWRDGDWDAFEGMAFPQWDINRHTCKPFAIDPGWYKWRAVDWGFRAPWCCLWFARQPGTQRIYVYREAYETLLNDIEQAQRIKAMTPPHESIHFTYADPSMWSQRSAGAIVTTSVDTYANNGVYLLKGDNDRRGGKAKVDVVLGDLPDGQPGLVVFDTCVHLIEQMGSLIYDENKVEDVDTDLEDHAYDTLRYGLTTVQNEPARPQVQQVSPFTQIQFGGRR